MVEATPQRMVPGAPPPTPLSKSQRKKRKAKTRPAEPESPVVIPEPTSAALLEKAPELSDVQPGVFPQELSVKTEAQASKVIEDEPSHKPSPIVELINKRLKATAKKISRISAYAAMDPEKLNDDQKRTMKTLPTLETIQKELGEVKKVIEVYELEQVHELALKRADAERAEKQRIADAVLIVQKSQNGKMANILSLLRLHTLLSTGELEALSLQLGDGEGAAIFAAAEILLGEEGERKEIVLNGLLSGRGDFQGTTYARLLEIIQLFLNPRCDPTPVPDELVESVDNLVAPESLTASTVIDDSEGAAFVSSGGPPGSGSFHFMQASEIETPSFEESTEWVENPDAEKPPHTTEVNLPVEASINGHSVLDDSTAVTTGEVQPLSSETIDWAADDEGGLPSIAGLHAKFGTSGTATPVEGPPPGPAQEEPLPVVNGSHINETASQEEGDGFTQARAGRGRGRGSFRGDRGVFRGGYRGDNRGSRSRGSFRGGDRGFRGRSNGEWRGDGDVHGRGRGRGRGDRGGMHEGRGGSPSTEA